MGKQLITIIAVGSLLGSEAVREIDTRGLHWMAAPDHNHTEIPEGVARGLAHLLSLTTANTYKVAHFFRSLLYLLRKCGSRARPRSVWDTSAQRKSRFHNTAITSTTMPITIPMARA
jgi:hypothetical protein